ncbi:hypothetical protein [Micromonospora sp. CPCC 206061]|uniref:hypothetical protein n=1 Tax=Micromonospora sp. CPCC 206061 TaxID=3122410 RepID=UPI002FF30CDA
MPVSWWPVLAITASRPLRAELWIIEQHIGWVFEYNESILDGRRYASRRRLIIVGADLIARIRNPLSCGGFVVVATVNPDSPQMFTHAERVGASYVIVLPTARSWLVHQLLHNVSELILRGRPRPATRARRDVQI